MAEPSVEKEPIESASDSVTPASSTSPTGRPPRQPLNPAISILIGAAVSALSLLAATVLTIRSSERTANERARTDLVTKEREELQRKIDKLESDLAEATKTLSSLQQGGTPIPNSSAAPVSIVVVITVPPTVDGTPPSTVAPATTRRVSPTSTELATTSSTPVINEPVGSPPTSSTTTTVVPTTVSPVTTT